MAEIRIRQIALAKLHPNPNNPRTLSDAAFERLKASLVADPEMLKVRPLVALPDGTVLFGNMRLRAAEALGWKTIPCATVDLNEAHAAEWLIKDNVSYGQWEEDMLAEMLAELEQASADLLPLTGFPDAELERLLDSVRGDPDVDRDADAIPPLPDAPISKLGEIYELGPHRLLCGDARDSDAVLRFFDGKEAAVAVTSPPYASQRSYDAESGFSSIPPSDYADWYEAVQLNIHAVLAESGSYFCNIKEHCDEGQRHLYVTDLLIAHIRSWGWSWVDTFCWRDTKNGVPGAWNNRFKDAWEPVYHYSKGNQIKMHALANGAASDAVFGYSPATQVAQTGSGLLGEKAVPKTMGWARPSNVLEIAASSSSGHPAAFPVALPAWFIRAFSDRDEIIFDPFAGSGSTLIAAQQQGRVCYAIEISPAYCDLIRQRYAEFVG